MDTSTKILAALAVLVAASAAGEAARILVVMPVDARSHHIAIGGITKALAERGHEVTYISGMEKGNKVHPANNKVIHINQRDSKDTSETKATFWEDTMSPVQATRFLMSYGIELVNRTMTSPTFLAEVNKPGQKYDLIIVQPFFFQEALVALGHQFNAPVVAINPFGNAPWSSDIMGNPVNPAWVPSLLLGYSDNMSFVERAINTLTFAVTHGMYHHYYLPKQQALVDVYWPDAPPLEELLRTRLGLAIVNSHYTLTYAVPMSPNMVEIAGMHVPEKTKPLPKDLQEYMDSSKEGVVFFSMGSFLSVKDMPKPLAEAIVGALGALKERVLLKWDGPAPQGLSPNIRLIEWAPQADLLAHPNMKLFVTHGGLHSTIESVYFGVPLIGIPVLGDQRFNMLNAVQKGFCIGLDFKTLTRATMDATLKEVLHNPRYKEAATRLSRLFRSRPIRPIDAAVFAVEHVLAHGADHLRPSSVGMPLYKLLLLDVGLVALLPLLAVALCCRALCCRGKKAAQDATAKRKKNN